MIIYKITNLINNKIYIGQHNGKRKSYFGGGKLLKLAIEKYGKTNFKKEILVDLDCSQKQIDELERQYISNYNSTDKNIGYNIQKGGFGIKPRTYTQTLEFKEKCRLRMIGNKIMLGLKDSEETKLLKSNSHKERLSKISKEDKSNSALKAVKTRRERYDIGKLISKSRQENKKLDWDNNQTRPIVKLTKENEILNIYPSAYFLQKTEGLTSSRISAVCNNIYSCKTYKGFKWRFATEEEILKAKVKK
jgi:group I intron endonuclease